jgi:hypothetical protein
VAGQREDICKANAIGADKADRIKQANKNQNP